MAQLQLSIEEYWQECISCGVWFGVAQTFNAERRKNKENFYCPNGHPLAYIEGEADKLRKQLAAKDRELQAEQQRLAMERQMRLDAEQNLERQKRAAKRQLKRVNAGVCPHCNRTFQQLARHMQCKHAEILAN